MDRSNRDPRDSSEGQGTQSRTKDKGKGKQTTLEAPLMTSGPAHTNQSIGSRIVSSASKLASNLITSTANGSDIGKALPPSKAGASNSSSGLLPSGQRPTVRDQHAFASGPSNSAFDHHPSGENSFRSLDTERHAAQQEAAFSSFLDGIPVLEPPLSLSSLTDTGDRSQTTLRQMNRIDEPSGDSPRFGSAGMQSEAAAPAQDGLDVVRLLNSNMYEEVMAATSEDEPIFSEEERISLRRALFGDGLDGTGDRPIDWNNLLNFVPSYVAVNDSDLGAAKERMAHMGTDQLGESQRVWEEQWAQVLTRYTDEVWGDLSSLVREARREVENAETEQPGPVAVGDPSGFPALRRLQQILGQIRGS
ncbi:uncharacterized protein B0I36DRAFT_322521 [Microdochium trichocladiopsis]|uniref:Uncharacterized protein n=1 Tax=Microdochium trichocladiopsis TaxID=1682393 RepID=A0A9P8Y897_9PEZI|nr:uncharacterized protein B0I36DRAFT_322521 [Microdochium trichocladiopsis]KAH7030816.1 hypothetical protein B0I36DRAFT_322521 [Microdochium trichocladiopsis]